jgi:hypothetical protein
LPRRISRRSSRSICPSMGEEGERNGMLINFFYVSLNHICIFYLNRHKFQRPLHINDPKNMLRII